MSQNNTQPFRRARSMMATIGAIMAASAGSAMEQFAQINAIGAYRSRGKSGKKAANKTSAHMANVRAARKKHNRVIR